MQLFLHTIKPACKTLSIALLCHLCTSCTRTSPAPIEYHIDNENKSHHVSHAIKLSPLNINTTATKRHNEDIKHPEEAHGVVKTHITKIRHVEKSQSISIKEPLPHNNDIKKHAANNDLLQTKHDNTSITTTDSQTIKASNQTEQYENIKDVDKQSIQSELEKELKLEQDLLNTKSNTTTTEEVKLNQENLNAEPPAHPKSKSSTSQVVLTPPEQPHLHIPPTIDENNTGPELLNPVAGTLVNKFGEFVDGKKINGINIRVAASEVIACEEGVVLRIKSSPNFGKTVIIQHKNIKVAYAQMDNILVKEGQHIIKGEKIATVKIGSKAHIAIQSNKNTILNPSRYFKY